MEGVKKCEICVNFVYRIFPQKVFFRNEWHLKHRILLFSIHLERMAQRVTRRERKNIHSTAYTIRIKSKRKR